MKWNYQISSQNPKQINNQNNTEPNCPKKHLEKDEEIKTKNFNDKKREEINFNKEKEKEEIVDIFASKEKCQEDIKSGPLLELYLQQSNNDIDTKKVKAKKKLQKRQSGGKPKNRQK